MKVFKNIKLSYVSDIDVGDKSPALGLFRFRALLNLAMLLTESGKARLIRSRILDIVIDVVAKHYSLLPFLWITVYRRNDCRQGYPVPSSSLLKRDAVSGRTVNLCRLATILCFVPLPRVRACSTHRPDQHFHFPRTLQRSEECS